MRPRPSPSVPWPGKNRAGRTSAPTFPSAMTSAISSTRWRIAPTPIPASSTRTWSSRAGPRPSASMAQPNSPHGPCSTDQGPRSKDPATMANGQKTVTLEVFRYLPEKEEQPRFQTYVVPFREDWVVLDALNYIKDYLDGTLTYR